MTTDPRRAVRVKVGREAASVAVDRVVLVTPDVRKIAAVAPVIVKREIMAREIAAPAIVALRDADSKVAAPVIADNSPTGVVMTGDQKDVGLVTVDRKIVVLKVGDRWDRVGITAPRHAMATAITVVR